MSIFEYNGSGVLAMVGKECVAIASDNRFSRQQQTLSSNFPKIFKVHDKLYLGLAGLATDIQTFWQKVLFEVKMYHLRENRYIKPSVFANLISTMLYKNRFGPWFIEPVIAGLNEDNTPYICAMDLLGAPVTSEGFCLSGTCSEQLYGMSEALFRPDMSQKDLFETISQSLLAAVDRDCLAGWGATVYIITSQSCTERHLKTRQD